MALYAGPWDLGTKCLLSTASDTSVESLSGSVAYLVENVIRVALRSVPPTLSSSALAISPSTSPISTDKILVCGYLASISSTAATMPRTVSVSTPGVPKPYTSMPCRSRRPSAISLLIRSFRRAADEREVVNQNCSTVESRLSVNCSADRLRRRYSALLVRRKPWLGRQSDEAPRPETGPNLFRAPHICSMPAVCLRRRREKLGKPHGNARGTYAGPRDKSTCKSTIRRRGHQVRADGPFAVNPSIRSSRQPDSADRAGPSGNAPHRHYCFSNVENGCIAGGSA